MTADRFLHDYSTNLPAFPMNGRRSAIMVLN